MLDREVETHCFQFTVTLRVDVEALSHPPDLTAAEVLRSELQRCVESLVGRVVREVQVANTGPTPEHQRVEYPDSLEIDARRRRGQAVIGSQSS